MPTFEAGLERIWPPARAVAFERNTLENLRLRARVVWLVCERESTRGSPACTALELCNVWSEFRRRNFALKPWDSAGFSLDLSLRPVHAHHICLSRDCLALLRLYCAHSAARSTTTQPSAFCKSQLRNTADPPESSALPSQHAQDSGDNHDLRCASDGRADLLGVALTD